MLSLLLLVFCLTVEGTLRPEAPDDCAMCDYVYRDDGVYTYSEYRDPSSGQGFTRYFINLTSQRWLDESWTNQPVWWHYLVINVPDEIQYPENAFFYIGANSNDDTPPGNQLRDEHRRTGTLTANTGMVSAVLEQVPNQPLIFTDDPDQKQRWEDDLVSYTWLKFLNDEEAEAGSGNPEEVLRMGMVKAAVKAMDCIQDFVNGLREEANIDKFLNIGESKRGNVAWIAGALDERVVAMAPTVLTDLNFHPNWHHIYQSFEGWPSWWSDYWITGILGRFDDPGAFELAKVDDPYSYLWGMDIPILVIAGSSDEFFILDDSHYFLEDLPGDNNYLWIIENVGHCLWCTGSTANQFWEMLETFTLAAANSGEEYNLPKMTWETDMDLSPDGTVCTSEDWQGEASIIVHTDTTPSSTSAWWSMSNDPMRRDWRTKGPNNFFEDTVEDLGDNNYRILYSVPNEADGFLVFYIKMTFPAPGGKQYYMTTDAQILPNCFPYEDCTGNECLGDLIN